MKMSNLQRNVIRLAMHNAEPYYSMKEREPSFFDTAFGFMFAMLVSIFAVIVVVAYYSGAR